MAAYVLLAGTPAGVLTDAAGNTRAGVSVYVYQRGTTTQVQVYSDQGVTPLTQPLTTDSFGQIPGYAASGQSVDYYDSVTQRRVQAEIVAGSDARFSDQRVPLDGSVTWTKLAGGLVAGGADTLVADPGGNAGDMLVRVGATFAVVPAGSTSQQLTVRSDGTVKWTDRPYVLLDAWGARGDGVADDASALAAAVAALGANGGAVVASAKTYLLKSTVSVPANVVIRGGGWGTIFKGDPLVGSGNPIFDVVRSGVLDYSGSIGGIGFENLQIDGGAVANGLIGVRCVRYTVGAPTEDSRNNWLTAVKIRHCDVGLRLIFDQGIRCSSVAFHENNTGLYASDLAQLGLFEQCDFRGNNTVGALLESSMNVATDQTADAPYDFLFNRCHWESNVGKGLVLDGATDCTFVGCKWEGNGGDAVTIQKVNGLFTPAGFNFIGCLWNGNVAAPTTYQLTATSGSRIRFFGSHFNGNATAGVNIASGVTGCTAVATQFDSTVTDPGGNLSRLWDVTQGQMTLRGAVDNTNATFGVIDMKSTNTTSAGTAMVLANGRGRFGYHGGNGFVQIDDAGTGKPISFWAKNAGATFAERLRITANGDLAIGGAPTLGGGVGVVSLLNAATNPTSNPTGGAIVYVDAADGLLKVREAGGLTSKLSASVFAPQMPNLVAPARPEEITATAAFTAVNQMRGCRVIVPKAGTLQGLYVYVGTGSGNAIGVVYDTGNATAGQRTALWTGASTPTGSGAVNGWVKLGDPGIAVTQSQHLDFALIVDNTTVTFARIPLLTNFALLPTGFWPAAGGAAPYLAWTVALGSFAAPGSQPESGLAAGSQLAYMIARVA